MINHVRNESRRVQNQYVLGAKVSWSMAVENLVKKPVAFEWLKFFLQLHLLFNGQLGPKSRDVFSVLTYFFKEIPKCEERYHAHPVNIILFDWET